MRTDLALVMFRRKYGRDPVPESFDQPRLRECRELVAFIEPGIAEREAAAAADAWDRAARLGRDRTTARLDLKFNPYRCAGRDPAYEGVCQMPKGHPGGCFNDDEVDA